MAEERYNPFSQKELKQMFATIKSKEYCNKQFANNINKRQLCYSQRSMGIVRYIGFAAFILGIALILFALFNTIYIPSESIKIFGPIGLFLLVAGLIWFIITYLLQRKIDQVL